MRQQSRFRGQRGAVIIHVAFALIALLAFSAFVIDQGLMYVSRRQAQNAADAGALAGALALAYDDGGSSTAIVRSAQHWAGNNIIWGQPNSSANVDVTLSGPGASIPPCGANPGCVRVDVMRNMPDRNNQIRGNPLPVYFSHLVGLANQGVRATATARALSADTTECLKPWIVPDKWVEHWCGTAQCSPNPGDYVLNASTFDKYTKSRGTIILDPTITAPDVYIPPDFTVNPPVYGSGYSSRLADGTPVDYGKQIILKIPNPNDPISSGWALNIDLAAPYDDGGSDVRYNIANCNGAPMSIALPGEQCNTIDVTKGCFGVQTGADVGNNTLGVADLVARDSTATWSTGANEVVGSRYSVSPRIVPVGVFNVDLYLSRGYDGSTGIVKMVNMLGFFVEGICRDMPSNKLEPYTPCQSNGSAVVGRLVNFPGTNRGIIPTGGPATFGVTIQLVR